MKWLLSALLAGAVASSGCRVCTLILTPGIRVTIMDAATAGPVPGDVTVTATEGSYTETVNAVLVAGAHVAHLANERAGTYRVEVQSPGYAPWVATGVRVTDDGCHVQTVDLTAELEKAN